MRFVILAFAAIALGSGTDVVVVRVEFEFVQDAQVGDAYYEMLVNSSPAADDIAIGCVMGDVKFLKYV